jgi:hypothetical protein
MEYWNSERWNVVRMERVTGKLGREELMEC